MAHELLEQVGNARFKLSLVVRSTEIAVCRVCKYAQIDEGSITKYRHNVWIYSYHYKEIEVNYRNKMLYLINERKKIEKAEEEKRNVREGAET